MMDNVRRSASSFFRSSVLELFTRSDDFDFIFEPPILNHKDANNSLMEPSTRPQRATDAHFAT